MVVKRAEEKREEGQLKWLQARLARLVGFGEAARDSDSRPLKSETLEMVNTIGDFNGL